MTITLDIPSDLEARLRREAGELGIGVPEYAAQVLSRSVALPPGDNSLRNLFDRWSREDATKDPAEIARRNEEFEEFKKAMNESHTSDRKVYP
jgi:hypothetical protein